MKTECECSDMQCPAHKGQANCTKRAVRRLYRIDMTDRTGTYFCQACADDAMASGLFS